VGSEALSFGSKAAKAALDSELEGSRGVEEGGSLGEGWRGEGQAERIWVCTRLENELKQLN
jgi:hypothetical protein